jgi:hypothetical protein
MKKVGRATVTAAMYPIQKALSENLLTFWGRFYEPVLGPILRTSFGADFTN